MSGAGGRGGKCVGEANVDTIIPDARHLLRFERFLQEEEKKTRKETNKLTRI